MRKVWYYTPGKHLSVNWKHPVELMCLITQSCLNLFDLVGCSLLCYSVHGVFQARNWSGLTFPPARDLSDPGIESTFPASPASEVDSWLAKPSGQLTELIALCKEGSISMLPWWLSGKEPTYQCRRCWFDTWFRKIPWIRKWQPTPVFLPGKSHGQRSLVGYSPWGLKELDTT